MLINSANDFADPRTPAPGVSVIIPSYNGERFVECAVRSILDQTFRDLELVVVDDGSSDGTRAILRRLAAADPRMRLIEKPNEGLIATLNRALELCRGALIARLDHDDIARPERIALQSRFLDENADFIGVGCLLQNIRADGTLMRKPRIRNEELVHDPGSFPPKVQWLYGPSIMVRAEAFRRVGGYRAKFLAAEDKDLCWRLGGIGRLHRLPQVLIEYRNHEQNMSLRRRRTQAFSAILGDLSAVARHFKLDDTEIIESIEVGGDYGPQLEAYRRLIGDRYPVNELILYAKMRQEIWNIAGCPSKKDLLKDVLRLLVERPLDPRRQFLLRRLGLYMFRKPRMVIGEAA